MNLREEAVSLIDGAFEDKWRPEDFVEGFSKAGKLCSGDQISAVAASILMDPSFRISDCTPVINNKYVSEVSIDLDQVFHQI